MNKDQDKLFEYAYHTCISNLYWYENTTDAECKQRCHGRLNVVRIMVGDLLGQKAQDQLDDLTRKAVDQLKASKLTPSNKYFRRFQ